MIRPNTHLVSRAMRSSVVALLAVILNAPGALAHDPIPTGTKRDFGGATETTYHLTNNPDTANNK